MLHYNWHNNSSFLQIFTLCLLNGAVLGFVPTITSKANIQSRTDVVTPLATQENNYNDDAFGFIFLGGSAAAHDPVFGAVFLTLSISAVLATKLEKLPATKQVPAAVAGFTLLGTPVISVFLPKTLYGVDLVPDDNGRWIELAFCSVSILYGFLFSSNENGYEE